MSEQTKKAIYEAMEGLKDYLSNLRGNGYAIDLLSVIQGITNYTDDYLAQQTEETD